ncbi:MAG: CopG family ribbon-helix-helix protein [Candidatus Odinarchaeota archaeon]
MNKDKRTKKPVTISLNPLLMEKIEKYKDYWGYNSRSKIIEDALKDYLAGGDEEEINEKVYAIISVFFNHHVHEVVSSLIAIQHHVERVSVKYSSHIHLSHDYCLEILVVEGESSAVNAMKQKIKAIEGINFVKTTILPPLSLVV